MLLKGGDYRTSLSFSFKSLVIGTQMMMMMMTVLNQRTNKLSIISQVEQTGAVAPTPEERHVANMQINGYENPTYKYFEVKE